MAVRYEVVIRIGSRVGPQVQIRVNVACLHSPDVAIAFTPGTGRRSTLLIQSEGMF